MFLTILTPTYNREHTLSKLYESLIKQTDKEFIWLIIDDGSIDNTYELVNNFIHEKKIVVRYFKKNNGGKHTAINEGIKLIETPLTFIVDSDDYLTANAIEIIKEYWNKFSKDENIGSFWFLQENSNGELIGNKFPQDLLISNYIEVMINSGVKGDKKTVFRTNVLLEFPFPIFIEEKFLGEGIILKPIGEKYKCIFINKVIYISDYLNDGLSRAGKKIRINNPLGGIALSEEFLTDNVNIKVRVKKIILLLTYTIIAKKSIFYCIKKNNIYFLGTFLLPAALLLSIKWKKYIDK